MHINCDQSTMGSSIAKDNSLLFVTQVVDINDSLLGVTHNWIARLSEKFNDIMVICLQKGPFLLQENVHVASLGKETAACGGIRFVRRILYICRFFNLIVRNRNEYNTVFVHMNPEYVLLAGWLWKLLSKKVFLWYVHPRKNILLKIALFFVDNVFTATLDTFPYISKKVIAIGHGIDTDFFKPKACIQQESNNLLFVGRLTPIKRANEFLDSCGLMRQMNSNFSVLIIGDLDERFNEYACMVEKKIFELIALGVARWIRSVPFTKIIEYYQRISFLVNLTESNSYDKVILEAMSSGLLVVTSNKAFEHILPSDLFLSDTSPNTIANKIYNIISIEKSERIAIGNNLRSYVIENNNLDIFIGKLYRIISDK